MIWLHSFSRTVAYSLPSTFSLRSLSSGPPNQISESFGSVAYQSLLFSSYLTCGKHNAMTLGNVSSTMDCLTWLNRNRSTACRLFAALIALMQMPRTSRNVLPSANA